MAKVVFFILSCILVFLVTIYFRLGAHRPVEISRSTETDLLLLFKKQTGPYHLVSSTISEIETWAARNNIPCRRTFGEYLDDPRQTEDRHLRSNVGCILEQAPRGISSPYQIKKLSVKNWVVARFDGAPSLGPLRVYPKVQSYLKENHLQQGGPVLEIYTTSGERAASTEYLFPVNEP